MRLVGLIIALGVIVLASLNGGGPGLFLDVGSLIIVVGITAGCMLSGGTSPLLLVKAVFGARQLSDDELCAAANACSRARTYALVSGLIGFVMGLIILGAFVDTVGSLGPGVALSLLTVLYGLVLSYVILLPVQNRLQDRIDNAQP